MADYSKETDGTVRGTARTGAPWVVAPETVLQALAEECRCLHLMALDLQDVLGGIAPPQGHAGGDLMARLQNVDRLTQSLDDIARALAWLAHNMDGTPLTDGDLARVIRLASIRTRIASGSLPHAEDSTPAGHVSLFHTSGDHGG